MSPTTWPINTWPWLDRAPSQPRLRVIIDNDFAGDPDDLYQLVHHLLSPSVEVVGIICSHLAEDDPGYVGIDTVEAGMTVLGELVEVMGIDAGQHVHRGSPTPLRSRGAPQPSAGADLIVAEAMRNELGLAPLVVVCGGGLTDLASAYLTEPRIAERLTAIWIGGPEHAGLGYRSPGLGDPEYNLNIDLIAAQVVLNDSDLPLWLVPRNVYRQCLVSDVELRRRVATKGPVGALLYRWIHAVYDYMSQHGVAVGEAYALGDSPLVLLTALQSFFDPDASSSNYAVRPCPELDDSGRFTDRTGRDVRVYTWVDTRLMFEDFFGKLDELSDWHQDAQT